MKVLFSMVAIVGIVATLIFCGAHSSQAQIVLRGGSALGADLPAVDSVATQVFKLHGDDDWLAAKGKLVELASHGQHVEVVYNLQRFMPNGTDKARARFESVLQALEEAGQYPLDPNEVGTRVAELEKALTRIKAGTAKEETSAHVLMALIQAEGKLHEAAKIIETGKLPKRSVPSATGRVIRLGGQ